MQIWHGITLSHYLWMTLWSKNTSRDTTISTNLFRKLWRVVKKEGVEVCVHNESSEEVVVHKSRTTVSHLARLGILT